MEKWELVQLHINSLTADEDLRQELWIHYLEGNTSHSLKSRLDSMLAKDLAESRLKEVIWDTIKNPPTVDFAEFLSSFSPLEQEVLCMLGLGYNISEISRYNGIDQVRLHQLIGNLRNSKSWEALWRLKQNSMKKNDTD